MIIFFFFASLQIYVYSYLIHCLAFLILELYISVKPHCAFFFCHTFFIQQCVVLNDNDMWMHIIINLLCIIVSLPCFIYYIFLMTLWIAFRVFCCHFAITHNIALDILVDDKFPRANLRIISREYVEESSWWVLGQEYVQFYWINTKIFPKVVILAFFYSGS